MRSSKKDKMKETNPPPQKRQMRKVIITEYSDGMVSVYLFPDSLNINEVKSDIFAQLGEYPIVTRIFNKDGSFKGILNLDTYEVVDFEDPLIIVSEEIRKSYREWHGYTSIKSDKLLIEHFTGTTDARLMRDLINTGL